MVDESSSTAIFPYPVDVLAARPAAEFAVALITAKAGYQVCALRDGVPER